MTLDSHLVFSGLCVFAKASAMLMTAPPFGSFVPVQVRVMFAMVLSMSLVGLVQPHIGPVPEDLIGLAMAVGSHVLAGLVIGGFLQILASTFQAAGSVLDIQIGTSSAQIFNPAFSGAVSPVGQFKLMLALVLMVLLGGHHMMIQAFIASFSMPPPGAQAAADHAVELAARTGLLALQIAAPVAAVTAVIDIAAGVVNKAVPQTQPFLIALPAKLAAGVLVLSIGLPVMVGAVNTGLDVTFELIGRALGGR